jgi:glycosyltransferase involved in cell wall biosynthesis
MQIALIEPYLVNYSGHYYNFVTELRRGFLEVDNRDVINIFVPRNCIIENGSFLKILPENKSLKGKNLFLKIFEVMSFLFKFYHALREIEKSHDILFFTTADGFKLLLLLCNISLKKRTFLYSHTFFLYQKERVILKFARPRSDSVYIITPIELKTEHMNIIEIIKKKKFNLKSNAPYPSHLVEKFELLQTNKSVFYVSYLGAASKAKGFIETVKFIEYCKENQISDYSFILQVIGNYDPEIEKYIQIVKKRLFDRVMVIEHDLPNQEYKRFLQKSSILLLLYDPVIYRNSISSILLEAFSFSKPVITRGGSWLAEQVSKYGGGVIVEDTRPETIRFVVERIKNYYERYVREAFEAGTELSKKYNSVELARLIKNEF